MIRFLALGLCTAFCAAAAAQDGEDPIGVWEREDGGSRMEISQCGGDLCAVNSWVRDSDCDERPGDLLVLSLRPIAPGRFEGEAHDERRDKTYSMTISVSPAGLRAEGCVLFGLLCKSALWIRAR